MKEDYLANEEDLKTEPSEILNHIEEPATF
jgi:hypothetical protein